MQNMAYIGELFEKAAARRKAAAEITPPPLPAPESPVENTMAQDQHAQDLHEQQLRFQEDKHQLEMQQLFQKLDQDQQAFGLTQEHAAQKQEQQMGPDPAQMQQMQQQQQLAQQQQQMEQTQQHDQQRVNMMGKAAQIQRLGMQKLSMTFNEYGEPIPESSALTPTLLGGAMGGGAAHALMPTDDTKRYRDLASEITPAQSQESWRAAKAGKVPKGLMSTVADTAHTGEKVKFKAPAHVRQRYFADRALQSNAKRLVGATGGGLLAGYLLHKALQPDA